MRWIDNTLDFGRLRQSGKETKKDFRLEYYFVEKESTVCYGAKSIEQTK